MADEIDGHIPSEVITAELVPVIGPLSYKDNLTQRLFGESLFLQHYTENATPLINTFDRYTFDAGLLQTREYQTPDGEILSAEGVSLYNRSAFLARALEIMKQDGFNGSFALMDIAKFRDADNAEDADGNKSADYLLNRIGKELINKISFLKSNYLKNNKKIDIEVSRYGGDEFMFLINGVTPQEREEILTELANATTGVKGFYVNSGAPVQAVHEENVTLKKMEKIEIPTASFERAIFEYYIPRGLILEPTEIQNIIKLHSTEMEEMLAQTTIPSIYPENLLDGTESPEEAMEKKTDYLFIRHPELEGPFTFAKDEVAKEAILKYVEKVMHDPLLHEVVMGFADLETHLSKADYSNAIVFDIKFIKEINDTRSIVEGDKAIQELWRQIQTKIGPEDRTNYQVYRRGGTFVIALKKEDPALQLKLEVLNQQKIRWNGIEIPLGYATRDLKGFNQEIKDIEAAQTPTVEKARKLYVQKRKRIRREFGSMLSETHQDWLSKIGQHIEHQMTEYGRPDVHDVEAKHDYTIDDLIYMYYGGMKRGIERNEEAIRFYQTHHNDKLTQYHTVLLENVKLMKELS